jgi:hypothetical protein
MSEPHLVSPEPQPQTHEIAYATAATPSPRQLAAARGITLGDVAVLIVKVVAIYVVLQAIYLSAYFVSIFVFRGYGWANLGFFIVMAVYVAVGMVLFLKASTIGLWLLPSRPIPSDVPPATGSPSQVQSIAFSIIAVFVATQSLPAFIVALLRFTYQSALNLPRDGSRDLAQTLLMPGIELLIAIALFLGSKRLSAYWQRIRGQTPARDDESTPL